MKLKKLASVAMAGVMAVSLAACGGSDTAKTTAADATTAAEAETTAAAEDAETKETEASEGTGRRRHCQGRFKDWLCLHRR